MAFGVFVTNEVSFIIVGVLAEVLLVFGSYRSAFCGLFNRQADASTLEVQVDDLDPEFFARGNYLFGKVNVVGRHFRNVHQSFDAVADLNK